MQNTEFQLPSQPTQAIPVAQENSQPTIETTVAPPKHSNFLKVSLLILVLILFGVALGVLAFYFLPLPAFLDKTAKWPMYLNSNLNIAIKYPPTWTFTETPGQKSSIFNTQTPNLASRTNGTINYTFSITEESPQNFELWSNRENTQILSPITINSYVFERYIVFDKYYSLNIVNKISDDKYILYSLYPYTETEQSTPLDQDLIQILTSFSSCDEPTFLTQCNNRLKCLPVGAKCN